VALVIPTDPKQMEERSLADLARELPSTANPFLQESWMGAQAIANARRVFEFYKQLRILELESVPITAEEKLQLWASIWGILLLPATQADGGMVATGIVGSVIPLSSQLVASDGTLYKTTSAAEINTIVVSIILLTSIGLVATAKLSSDNPLFTGQSVTISGAAQAQYNGTFTITVIGTDEFTYAIPSFAPVGTGVIVMTVVMASFTVQSIEFGQSQNQLANASLKFSTPIIGVDANARVDFGAIGGGSDQETLDSLRTRMLERIQNPVALFNASAIISQAKKVAGVTDVFVDEITPQVGQVTIYFVRRNDASPIPEASEVAEVKQKILLIKPAHTADADVIVLAPSPATANFVFTSVTPNTPTMKAAIAANLKALFEDFATVGVALTATQYNYAIASAIDASTGALVIDFVLSSPVGNIGGAANQYPVLGSVTFA